MSSDTEVKKSSRRRKNQGMAMVAAGALLLSGPLVAGAVAADTLTATSSGDSGSSDYVGPDAQQYGTIEVSSGTIDQVTSTESGAFGMEFIDGHPHGPVLIQQLEVKGDGDFTVLDPAPAKVPKNLNSFNPTIVDIVNADGEEPTEDEKENGPTYAKWEDTVTDGETKQYRWLGALPEDRIPFRLKPTYILDGQTYSDPNDMVGKSGEVEVRFQWNAVGQRETTVYFLDGSGNPVEQTGPIYLPSVGVFKLPLPSNFTNVRPITMDAGGDGYGGTLLAGTLVMAPPLGPEEITVGFKANVENFYMPTGIVEWVYANVQDNASFATIGAVLGGLGGALTGAAQGLQGAGLNQGLTTLAKITDGVSGLFDGLTTVQGVLQRVNRALGTVTSGVASVNGALNRVIDNGGPLGECDVTGTLDALLSIVKGESPPSGVNYCSLLDLQTVGKNLLVGTADNEGPLTFLQRMLKQRLDPLTADVVSGLEALESGACSGSTISSDYQGAPVNTLVNALAAAVQNPVARALVEELGLGGVLGPLDDLYESNEKYTPRCGLATLINPTALGSQIDSSDLPNLVLDVNASVLGPFAQLLLRMTVEPTVDVPGIDATQTIGPVSLAPLADPICQAAFPVPPKIPNGALQAGCKAAVNSASVTLNVNIQEPGWTYTDGAPIEYLVQVIKGKVGALALDITVQVLRALAGIQQLTNQVISGVSSIGTFVSGANSAIGRISTTINSVIFQGLSGLLNGLNNTLATALPALGNSLGNTATTLNYEYAVFNAYSFMATLGGAQPYGPPWKPQDITEYQVDPATGVVVTPPTTAGAPLDGGETQPASDLNPVPGTPPPPGEADGDPTVQAIDKAGYTAYQVDLLGFGGERSVNAGIYFAAIAALLIGGIVGGLVMRSRK